MDREAFEPEAVRYIKLGSGGIWADEAIRDGIIPFGFPEADHADCAAGDWKAVRRQLAAAGRGSQAIAGDLSELRTFYEADPETLWITFADGYLWWALADGSVRPVQDPAPEPSSRSSMEEKMSFPIGFKGPSSDHGPPRPTNDVWPWTPTRYRLTRDGWYCESLTGEPLSVRTLSSVLTKTANYRRAICRVPAESYLLRRIRGEPNPVHKEALAARDGVRELAARMIAELHWAEFETLVDLIFARGGWRRNSPLGKTMPDVDLVLDQPITGETAWVQVKSRTTQAELDDYLDRFERDGSCDRFFFVCHGHAGTLTLNAGAGYHLWTGVEIADKAINVGLFEWLIERTR